MTVAPPLLYLAAFAASAVLSLVLTPVALRVALRRSFLDMPGAHKGHQSPIPYLGGLAIVVAFAGAVLVASRFVDVARAGASFRLALVAAIFLAVLGLVDDVRRLPVWVRVAAEVAAGVLVWGLGLGVELIDGVEVVNAALTVVWVVGVTNAFNLLDNMDGLSAGVAAIAAVSFFVIAALNDQQLVAVFSVALAGCSLGFLRHNRYPARIYMGDAGSLFLGFVLSVIGISLRFEAPRHITFLVPIVVLAVPLFDMILVSVTRLRRGTSPFKGGRDHTSHRLVSLGLSVPVAVTVILAAGLASGWLALVLVRLDALTAWLLTGFVGVVALTWGVLLGAVPVADGQATSPLTLRRRDPTSVVDPGPGEPGEDGGRTTAEH